MAITAILLCSSTSIFFQNFPISSSCTSSPPLISKTRPPSFKLQAYDQSCYLVKNSEFLDFKTKQASEKIQEVHCIEEYDNHLQTFSQEKLVIAHFSASHHKYNSKIQQFMKEQCRSSNAVTFLNVIANESDKTRELCRRENIDKIPYFVFYRKTEKIHEEAGFQRQKLEHDILYYKEDPFSPVVQLQSREDLDKLIKVHKLDNKLIVVNVGTRQCLPCVRIYPNVLKLASQMSGRVVFARMNADENESCMEIMGKMDVLRVPAFLFLRNGEFCGRYVGSCASRLIREIVKLRTDHRVNVFLMENSF